MKQRLLALLLAATLALTPVSALAAEPGESEETAPAAEEMLFDTQEAAQPEESTRYTLGPGGVYEDGALLIPTEQTFAALAEIDGNLYGITESEEWVLLQGTLSVEALRLDASSTESTIFNFCLDDLNLNIAAACGVLANIYSESSFNPRASVIDSNGLESFGLCQWNGSRLNDLKTYCSDNDLNYQTLDAQLAFLKYELMGSEKSTYSKLRDVDETEEGAYKAGYDWARYFERCASRYYESRAERARDIYWPKYQDSISGGIRYETINAEVELRKGKTFYVYSEPGADDYYTMIDGGVTLMVGRSARLRNGKIWYEVRARINNKNRWVWIEQDNNMTIVFQTTVTFDPNGNGAEVSPTSAVVSEGEVYGTLPEPSWSGYTFEGWYTLAEGGSLVTAKTIVPTSEDHYLFAHWTDNNLVKYAVTGGYLTFDKENNSIVECDMSVTAAVIPTRISGLKVLRIENSAFKDHNALTFLKMEEGVTNLGGSAFRGCQNLKTVSIPYTLKSLGYGSFAECSSLETVYYASAQGDFNRISNSGANEPFYAASIVYNSTGPDQPDPVDPDPVIPDPVDPDPVDPDPVEPDPPLPEIDMVAATAYVQRCYREVLGREGELEGISTWVNELAKGVSAGRIVLEFFRSEEFRLQNLSNEEIVRRCYAAMLGRAPDPEGLVNWVGWLERGYTPAWLCDNFVQSAEFQNICETYGLSAGTLGLGAHELNRNVTAFVERCYREALSREPDTAGLDNWCLALLSGSLTPERVAFGFVFSDEVTQKNLFNSQFMTMLYHMMMNREPDLGGIMNWVYALDVGEAAGRSRSEVRQEAYGLFAQSEEFQNIVASFGL